MSFLNTLEERNNKLNSFSIKGSMIENPVGDIDIVDKRNLKTSKGNTPSNSNLLRFGAPAQRLNHEDLNSKLNLSHIKISSNNITHSLMNNPQFNSKSNMSVAASPNMTIDSSKITLPSQVK
jgi:hypothetical protein